MRTERILAAGLAALAAAACAEPGGNEMDASHDDGGAADATKVEAFAEAVKGGRAEEVETALARDPDLATARGADGVSLLLTAYYHGRPELAELLRARRDALDVFEAAATGDLPELRRALADDAARIDARSPDGFTPLHLAAFLGRPRAARVLLAAGADTDAVAENPSEVTPLHSAAASRRADVVRVLLAAGADPDARQARGFTALQAAALHGDVAMTTALLAHGADPALRAEDGRDASAMAGESGARAVVALLADRLRALGAR